MCWLSSRTRSTYFNYRKPRYYFSNLVNAFEWRRISCVRLFPLDEGKRWHNLYFNSKWWWRPHFIIILNDNRLEWKPNNSSKLSICSKCSQLGRYWLYVNTPNSCNTLSNFINCKYNFWCWNKLNIWSSTCWSINYSLWWE